jgi:hypothetical protein
VSWDSLVERHVQEVDRANRSTDEEEAERQGRQTGKYKKVSTTDPDATMATSARNRRLEPAYKQHAAVDDLRGVILDVEVTTGESNEGKVVAERVDVTMVRCQERYREVPARQGLTVWQPSRPWALLLRAQARLQPLFSCLDLYL